MTDTFGPRFSGTPALEAALDWIVKTAREDGLVVTEQPVQIPKWVRGNEYAKMVSPRNHTFDMIGLGMSNRTYGPDGLPGPVRAPVIVVANYSELLQLNASGLTAGKIVLFNWPTWLGYGNTVGVRVQAATWAASCGAVGALIKSISPWGIVPHTGSSAVSTIASAALTSFDAALLDRMYRRGQSPVVEMYMEAQLLEDSPSRNVIIDLPGNSKPDEYVVFGGHSDSWDIAHGAMDDGGGGIGGAWHALRLLSRLNISAARTLRAVLWVNEENGARGGAQFALANATANNLTSIAIECDEGSFTPWQLSFSGHPAALNQLQILSSLLAPIGAGNISTGGGGTDIDALESAGVPVASLNVLDVRINAADTNANPCVGLPATTVDAWTASGARTVNDQYFAFHHTRLDTAMIEDPTQLNLVASAFAIWAYAIGTLPELLPRSGDVPPIPTPTPNADSGSSSTGVVVGSVIGSALVLGLGAAVYYRRIKGGVKSVGQVYAPLDTPGEPLK